MRAYLKWRLALALCALASAILVPLSLAAVWLARLVHRAQDAAETELLFAAARRRVAIQRKDRP
ncbi:hypothetical protein [Aquabacterium sp.]|uniref:hypothetical protein n=1 Tax=Aquabacterium sp. TaxID=1872578 RepID=UPI0025C614DC|nr:hypothetical protein [Aquabacterium sp.]